MTVSCHSVDQYILWLIEPNKSINFLTNLWMAPQKKACVVCVCLSACLCIASDIAGIELIIDVWAIQNSSMAWNSSYTLAAVAAVTLGQQQCIGGTRSGSSARAAAFLQRDGELRQNSPNSCRIQSNYAIALRGLFYISAGEDTTRRAYSAGRIQSMVPINGAFCHSTDLSPSGYTTRQSKFILWAQLGWSWWSEAKRGKARQSDHSFVVSEWASWPCA